MREIAELIVRMAKNNPSWGYRRIQGALRNVGIEEVAHNTVRNALKNAGIEPAPERSKRTTWSQFLKIHWDTLVATDFFTTEVWTIKGLVTFYTLFLIHVSSRRVHIVGSTPNPDRVFLKQAALDVVAFDDGFLRGSTHLIMDRDGKFTNEFRSILEDHGVQAVRIPARSPNCNPHAERFVRTISEECLSRMILFGHRALDRAIVAFVAHYHQERNHPRLGNNLITPDGALRQNREEALRQQRLGGRLSFYHRAAA
jgi:transposase InsO family protein